MFSSRTGWDLTENRLTSLLAAKRQAGTHVLDLTESNPTRVGISRPADLLTPFAQAASLAYEPHPRGLRAARQAVAADYARRGARLDPDRVVLTSSTSEAYAFLFKLLCDPGDAILVPHPSYPLFEYLARLESVEVGGYPLLYDGAWHLDPAAVADAMTPRVRAVILVSPNNPTGSYVKRDEAERLLDECARRDVAVVCDEVFADYVFADGGRRPATLAGDSPALLFSLGGLAKSCGLPQLKLSWIAVSGPNAVRDQALARLEIVADTFLSVSTPVQHAAPALLGRLQELQAPIASRVASNLRSARRLAAGSAASLLEPEGGWYAVLRVPATVPEEERVCGLLEARNVLVHPGYFFDFPHEAFLVLSLLPAEQDFVDGVTRVLTEL